MDPRGPGLEGLHSTEALGTAPSIIINNLGMPAGHIEYNPQVPYAPKTQVRCNWVFAWDSVHGVHTMLCMGRKKVEGCAESSDFIMARLRDLNSYFRGGLKSWQSREASCFLSSLQADACIPSPTPAPLQGRSQGQGVPFISSVHCPEEAAARSPQRSWRELRPCKAQPAQGGGLNGGHADRGKGSPSRPGMC